MIVASFRWKRDEGEPTREIDSHLVLLEEEHRRRGMTADEARLAARGAMGSVALAKDLPVTRDRLCGSTT